MGSLQAVDELKEENEIVDQVCRIQKLESALQKGHPDFVHLSQLAVELIDKLDSSSEADANQIRQQIETITQRWDTIVARIDEHSHMVCPILNSQLSFPKRGKRRKFNLFQFQLLPIYAIFLYLN